MDSDLREFYFTKYQRKATIRYRWPYSYEVKLYGRQKTLIIPSLPEDTEKELFRIAEKLVGQLVDYYSESAENVRHLEDINDRYYQKNSSEPASGSPVGAYLSEEYRKRTKQESARKSKKD